MRIRARVSGRVGVRVRVKVHFFFSTVAQIVVRWKDQPFTLLKVIQMVLA